LPSRATVLTNLRNGMGRFRALGRRLVAVFAVPESDAASGKRWSAGFQPSGKAPERYEASFAEDRAEFDRRDGVIETRLEIVVAPGDDAEIRRVSLTNHGSRAREIEVTSYAEIVLAPAAGDAAHPAFSNLFIQTECVPSRDTLLATRRRQAPDEAEIWLAHTVAVDGETIGAWAAEILFLAAAAVTPLRRPGKATLQPY